MSVLGRYRRIQNDRTPTRIDEESSILRNIRVDTGLRYDNRLTNGAINNDPPETTRKVKA
jgi:hypothetical protein